MTYTLSNDLLTVSIQDAGAQLCSVTLELSLIHI